MTIADCPDCGRCEPFRGSCPWCGGPVLQVGGVASRLARRLPWLRRLRLVSRAKAATLNLVLPFRGRLQ